MRQFEKPPLSVPEQLLLLKRRGLAIEDDNRAQSFLETVSFFVCRLICVRSSELMTLTMVFRLALK